MPSRRERLCDGCGFPARRGKVPIIWPGLPPAGRIVCCSLACAERKGVQMHPLQRELHLAAEES